MSNKATRRSILTRKVVAVVVATVAVSMVGGLMHGQDLELSLQEITVHADIPYADGFLMDIHVPDGPGPFPAVLTLHGASGGKASMDPLAGPLSAHGFIVFNAAWLVAERPLDAAGLVRSVEAAGCALRFAGAHAPDYGGDGRPLTVIGKSAGGLSGALVSLQGSEFGKVCETLGPVPAVALFIGFEGGYLNVAEGTGGLAPVIEEQPDLARRLDPRSYLGGVAGLRVVLFLGDQFERAVPVSERFHDALRGAGIPSEIRRVIGPHEASTMTPGVLSLLAEKPNP